VVRLWSDDVRHCHMSSRGVHGEAMKRCKVLSLSHEGYHSRKGRPCFYLLKVINESHR
jgi:hypothetical protein